MAKIAHHGILGNGRIGKSEIAAPVHTPQIVAHSMKCRKNR